MSGPEIMTLKSESALFDLNTKSTKVIKCFQVISMVALNFEIVSLHTECPFFATDR